MDYLKQKLQLAQVNKKDEIISPIDRWQAHKEGILHRGFTAIIKIDDKIVIQKRKHLVFDMVFDLSFSSHPIFIKNKLEKMEDSIKKNLKREWFLKGKITELKFLEKYHYQEKDEKSGYIENEINYLYLVKIKGTLKNNPEYSYGMDFLTVESLLKKFKQFNFAPWVKKISIKNLEKYVSL